MTDTPPESRPVPRIRPLRRPSATRLRRPQDFQKTYDRKQRWSDRFVLVFAAPNGLPVARLGLSVSKKHGGAVVRNRIKRLLREAFRLSRAAIPVGLDLVVVPRQDGGATLADLRRSLEAAAATLARRILRGPRESAADDSTGGAEREKRPARGTAASGSGPSNPARPAGEAP